jgi:DNA-binding LytR/AlgR family response regulator
LSIFDRAETALPFILKNNPDLLLADIKLLGKTDGISMVEELQRQVKLPVIYITANSDKATYDRAKKTNPHAFLVKPFSTINLLAAIDLALYNFSSGQSPHDISRNSVASHHHTDGQFLVNQCLFIRTNGKHKKVVSDNILYIEASGSYIHIQTLSERFTLSQNLSQFQKKTPLADFVRVHRSYLINITKVEAFDEAHVFIGNQRIPISETYRADFLNRIHCI